MNMIISLCKPHADDLQLTEIQFRSIRHFVSEGEEYAWISRNIISYRQVQNERVENNEKMARKIIIQKGVGRDI